MCLQAWACVHTHTHTYISVFHYPGLQTGPGLTYRSRLLDRWQGVCNHHLSKVQTDYYLPTHTYTLQHTHFYNQCGWPDFPHHYPGRQEIEKSHQYHISLLRWMANGRSMVRFFFFSILHKVGDPHCTPSLLVTPTTPTTCPEDE